MGLPRNFSSNPFEQFERWFAEAEACPAVLQANAMCLSTVTPEGYPDGRMVLLKGRDTRGFVFYTNLESTKGQSLAAVARAALTFHWDPLKRQIRIQGDSQKVTEEEADAYWKTRPRLSQIGGWASDQSRPLANHRTFIERLSQVAKKFENVDVPRPAHWTGLRVIPKRIEFWRERRGRLHERIVYVRDAKAWSTLRLYP